MRNCRATKVILFHLIILNAAAGLLFEGYDVISGAGVLVVVVVVVVVVAAAAAALPPADAIILDFVSTVAPVYSVVIYIALVAVKAAATALSVAAAVVF